MNKFFFATRSGFTLLELIIVMALSGVVLGFGVSSVLRIGESKSLYLERDRIVIFLNSAEERSRNQEEGYIWGVHFDNSNSNSPFYSIFYGSTYSSAVSRQTNYLSNKLKFIVPVSLASLDIIFDKLSGQPTSSQKVIVQSIYSPQLTSEVNVSSTGVITYK